MLYDCFLSDHNFISNEWNSIIFLRSKDIAEWNKIKKMKNNSVKIKKNENKKLDFGLLYDM